MNQSKKLAMRDAFSEAMVELGEKYQNVIALTADLESSTRLENFHKHFPDRFYQVGVAEQNLIGISAGMAMMGFVPFACSFAAFLTGRAWEFIRICIAANNLPVKLVGSHAGFSHQADGFTAQATEDLALMQVLPKMTVVYPADANQIKKAVYEVYKYAAPVYLRITREPTPVFTKQKDEFKIGKAQVLKKGNKATVISSGPLLAEVLKTAEEIKGLEVINLHTLKPFDKKTISKSLQKTKKLITVEDHQTIGGVASAVAANIDFPHQRLNIGIKNKFGKTAQSYLQLLREYSLDSESLSKQINNFLK